MHPSWSKEMNEITQKFNDYCFCNLENDLQSYEADLQRKALQPISSFPIDLFKMF